jgi:hypothetical protein
MLASFQAHYLKNEIKHFDIAEVWTLSFSVQEPLGKPIMFQPAEPGGGGPAP